MFLDFLNGWDTGILQDAIDRCNCNPYGDPTCCAAQGIFDFEQNKQCYVTDTIDEKSECSNFSCDTLLSQPASIGNN